MDYGDKTLDERYAPYQQAVDALFAELGWTEPYVVTQFFPGAAHDETSWQERLHIPLTLLLGAE